MKCVYDPTSGNIYRMTNRQAKYIILKYGKDGVKYISKSIWKETGRKTEANRINGMYR